MSSLQCLDKRLYIFFLYVYKHILAAVEQPQSWNYE